MYTSESVPGACRHGEGGERLAGGHAQVGAGWVAADCAAAKAFIPAAGGKCTSRAAEDKEQMCTHCSGLLPLPPATGSGGLPPPHLACRGAIVVPSGQLLGLGGHLGQHARLGALHKARQTRTTLSATRATSSSKSLEPIGPACGRSRAPWRAAAVARASRPLTHHVRASAANPHIPAPQGDMMSSGELGGADAGVWGSRACKALTSPDPTPYQPQLTRR